MNSLKRTLICFVLLLSSALLYAGVPSEFTYQGRIREAGQQKTGTYTMNFKIYSLATGGSSLWESGNQTIAVTNGMFSYRMAPTIDWRLQDLYLETVLNGTVLTPREKLTSHFFALHSGTAENISSTSTVTITLGSTPRLTIDTNGEVKNLMGGSTFYMVPRGGIIMWSGAIAAIPPGWGLCDGKWYDPTSITAGQSGLASSGGSYYVQTPDLTDRFILSVANSSENPGAIGNQNFRTITSDQLPAHSHNAYSGGASNDHTHAVGSTDLSHSHAMGHTHTLS